MQRLLEALRRTDYKNQQITLIISIDHSDDDIVEKYAYDFTWSYGEKIVKTYPKRQGLREHILACGNYLNEYDLDAVAVFEDDIYPSPAFFNYMQQAVTFYMEDDRVAGISLYTHLWNVTASMPFQPVYSGYDNFFMRFAQSWGQIWCRRQWNAFMDWYQEHQDLNTVSGIPAYVKNWPESSWLKYHIAYCVDQRKYFIYPYESLVTCMAEAGEHTVSGTNLYEVPMQNNIYKEYRFRELTESAVRYDAFFEREGLGGILAIDEAYLCVDLYGKKGNAQNARYWLTTRCEPYEVQRSFGLQLRPHEENVWKQMEGKQIFLYDTRCSAKRPEMIYDNLSYYYRLDCDEMWLVKYALKKKCDRILRRWKNKITKETKV
jgi:hypothetical protein